LTYERAVKDTKARDELVKPHELEEGEWVLVRHENSQKFEAKWFGPYQVVQKMLLGTYRLHDPNGRELATLVHGNRLVKATVRTVDELRNLWASPQAKDKLRRLNRNIELIPSYPENTDALDQYLQNDDDEEPHNDVAPPKPIVLPPIVRKNLKRKRGPEMHEEIIVERP
jgi:hypothetical protein